MPAYTLLERSILDLLVNKHDPKAQNLAQHLHYVVSENPVQQARVYQALALLAKRSFVDLKEPSPSATTVQSSPPVGPDEVAATPPTQLFWESVSTKKLWVVLRFGNGTNTALMRQTAVGVLCARTNAFCPDFRVIVLLQNMSEFHQLPTMCRLLAGMKPGRTRYLNLGNSSDADPQPVQEHDTGVWLEPEMRMEEPMLEEWLDYSMVDDAEGEISSLQEDIFNSKPEITTVTYSRRYGKGSPYIRILRDALKFNIVVHTLDMTNSECGDVIGMCLTSILYTSRKLKTLILDNCSLTDAGVTTLTRAVALNESVVSLSLRKNPSMTDISIVAIAALFHSPTTRVTALDMSDNNVIYDTRFEWTSSAMGKLWEALGKYQRLQTLRVSNCGLVRATLREMTTLWLAKAAPSQNAASGLMMLDLSHNYIGDVTIAEMLPLLPHVVDLNLEHVQLGAQGFRAIGFAFSEGTMLKCLERLVLDANNASLETSIDPPEAMEGVEGAGLISEAMQRVMLDTSSFSALLMIESLAGNSTLKRLSLSRSMVGDDAVITLCSLLMDRKCGVRHVDISSNCNVEEVSAHKIKELLVGGYFSDEGISSDSEQRPPLIESLSLAGNSVAIGERALLALYQNKGLTRLDVSNMALVDAMLLPLTEAFKTPPCGLCIQELLVGRNQLWFDGVANIAGHVVLSRTLTYVSLAGTWAAFDDEAGRPTRLSKSKLEGLHYLSPLLRALQGERDLARISTPLHILTGSGASSGMISAAPSGSPKKQIRSGDDQCLSTNLSYPTLEVLDLSNNDVSEACALGIANAVKYNTTLRCVYLFDNPILSHSFMETLDDSRLMAFRSE